MLCFLLQCTEVCLADGSTVSGLLVVDKVNYSYFFCNVGSSLRRDGYLSVLQDRVLMETVGAVQELKEIVVSHTIAS